jgi:hypothetical protein
MTTSIKFSRCYSLLGAFPDDDWDTLKTKYRRQVRRWHPDRYGDEGSRVVAGEKTKELNAAFETLGNYFHLHGRLPLVEVGTADALNTIPHSGERNDVRPAPLRTGVADNTSATHRKRYVIVAGALFVAFSYYLFVEDVDQDIVAESGDFIDERSIHRSPQGAHGDDALLGETPKPRAPLKKVSSKPSGTDPATYPYPVSPTPSVAPPLVIRRGSTKDEVLALQGQPQRESQAIWEYGASRIYFHHGRVIGWDENPENPLKLTP